MSGLFILVIQLDTYGDIPSGYLLHSHGKSPFLIGKPSIHGPFSMAMLNNHIYIYMHTYILVGISNGDVFN